MPLPRLDGGGVREQKEKEIMQGGDFLAKIAALHWCGQQDSNLHAFGSGT